MGERVVVGEREPVAHYACVCVVVRVERHDATRRATREAVAAAAAVSEKQRAAAASVRRVAGQSGAILANFVEERLVVDEVVLHVETRQELKCWSNDRDVHAVLLEERHY